MKRSLNIYIKSDNKPYPLRLGTLKGILLSEANSTDDSLHHHIRSILQKHVEATHGITIKFKRVRKVDL